MGLQVIESAHAMQSEAVRLRSGGKLIALVATSGYLHAGHRQLIELARERADVVVVSCLVNPKAFGPNEDFARYPRDRRHDEQVCREAEVDILFVPRAEELFPSGYSTYVSEEKLAAGMCGVSRPHYFRGACTLFAVLFNLVRPDVAVFGRKDPQLAAVVRKMADDLHFPTDIIVGETVRDPDGLAVSARNAYLNDFQRKDATCVYRALQQGARLVADQGVRNIDRVLAEVTHHLTQLRRIRVIYVVAVDPETMEPRREVVPGQTLIATAVWCDEVRLLDAVIV